MSSKLNILHLDLGVDQQLGQLGVVAEDVPRVPSREKLLPGSDQLNEVPACQRVGGGGCLVPLLRRSQHRLVVGVGGGRRVHGGHVGAVVDQLADLLVLGGEDAELPVLAEHSVGHLLDDQLLVEAVPQLFLLLQRLLHGLQRLLCGLPRLLCDLQLHADLLGRGRDEVQLQPHHQFLRRGGDAGKAVERARLHHLLLLSGRLRGGGGRLQGRRRHRGELEALTCGHRRRC